MSKHKTLMAGLALSLIGAPLAGQSTYMFDEDDATVTVQNNRDEKVIVYLDHGPFERTLGEVEAMRTMTFELPDGSIRPWTESVRLLVQPEGGLALEASALITRHDDDEPVRLSLLVPGEDEQLPVMSTERVATVLPMEYLDDATVTVRNERDEPADVFIQYGSFDQRLGRVGAMSVMTFRIPEGLIGRSGQILLVPDDGLPMTSGDLALDADAHLGVVLD